MSLEFTPPEAFASPIKNPIIADTFSAPLMLGTETVARCLFTENQTVQRQLFSKKLTLNRLIADWPSLLVWVSGSLDRHALQVAIIGHDKKYSGKYDNELNHNRRREARPRGRPKLTGDQGVPVLPGQGKLL